MESFNGVTPKYAIGQRVQLRESEQRGLVVGLAVYQDRTAPDYCVRLRNAAGDQVTEWHGETGLQAA